MFEFIAPDFRNWYWFVGDDEDRVYSSSRNAFVSTGDATFMGWREKNAIVPRIQSQSDLWELLKEHAPGHVPGWMFDGQNFVPEADGSFPKAQLQAFAAQARYDAEAAGIEVNGIHLDTSRESQAMIANAYTFLQASGVKSVKYKAESGFVDLTSAQVKALALAIGAHVQRCFAVEAEVIRRINLPSPTVTTAEHITAMFANPETV